MSKPHCQANKSSVSCNSNKWPQIWPNQTVQIDHWMSRSKQLHITHIQIGVYIIKNRSEKSHSSKLLSLNDAQLLRIPTNEIQVAIWCNLQTRIYFVTNALAAFDHNTNTDRHAAFPFVVHCISPTFISHPIHSLVHITCKCTRQWKKKTLFCGCCCWCWLKANISQKIA